MPNAVVQLERLIPVPLRTAWPNEALNFTPWLAEEGSLDLLGDAIGMDLELVSVETAVGEFSADILAREVGSGRFVVIENQLENTDHRHLGQIITYAAGLEAKTMVWLAQKFSDQHLAAVDFMNNSTIEDYAFFAVEINLFQVGSAFVPSFSVRAKPNGWTRMAQAKQQAAETPTSPGQELNKRFWSALIAEAREAYPSLARRTPYKTSWQAVERLRSLPGITVDLNLAFTWDARLRTELYFGGRLAKAGFLAVQSRQNELPADLAPLLEWEFLPDRQDSRIACYMPGEQRRDKELDWPSQRTWLLGMIPRLAECFRGLLQELNSSELEALASAPATEEAD